VFTWKKHEQSPGVENVPLRIQLNQVETAASQYAQKLNFLLYFHVSLHLKASKLRGDHGHGLLYKFTPQDLPRRRLRYRADEGHSTDFLVWCNLPKKNQA
jgi:hypothetical protein